MLSFTIKYRHISLWEIYGLHTSWQQFDVRNVLEISCHKVYIEKKKTVTKDHNLPLCFLSSSSAPKRFPFLFCWVLWHPSFHVIKIHPNECLVCCIYLLLSMIFMQCWFLMCLNLNYSNFPVRCSKLP